MRSPLHFFVLLFFLLFLILFIQIEIFRLVLDKLGLSPESAITLLVATLIGSAINLPLFKIDAQQPPAPPELPFQYRLFRPLPFTGKTLIAINVGGALIPLLFSIYLLMNTPVTLLQALIAVSIVSLISYTFSRPIQGLGVGMPIFIAPLSAALTAILIAPDNSAPLAYICGTMGVLIGADLFRLKDIPKLGAPIASIGGAGTFDGIFFTGIIAVLLA